MVVHGTDPYNAEPEPHALAGLHLTPLDIFYTRNHGPIPNLDPSTWRLRIDGLVATPLELSMTALQEDFEQHAVTATLQCAGNRRSDLNQVRRVAGEDPWGPGATSTATWTGARLADVLWTAGIQKDARHVCFGAPDRTEPTHQAHGGHPAHPAATYGSSVEVDKALSDEVLLAWQMNGQALPAVHGAPVRVVVPGYIGARSVKWLDRVTASLHPSDNYFQRTAYRLLPAHGTPGPGVGMSLGPVALNSAILVPADGTPIPVGLTDVHGYAYAGDRGTARVDVSLDDGATWIEAELDDQAGPWTWCLWRTTLALQEGTARISVRAWDTAGATQPRSAREVWNPKGYLNTSWARATITVLPAKNGGNSASAVKVPESI